MCVCVCVCVCVSFPNESSIKFHVSNIIGAHNHIFLLN